MKYTVTLFIILFALGTTSHDLRGDAPSTTLTLADAGRTDYTIIIANDAEAGEEIAAEELAYFLEKATGAVFPIRRDDTSPGAKEVVIGHTNRKRLDEVPEDLRSDNWEGYTMLPEGQRLYILGDIPRGTLYGVYDFLDLELGIRFLSDRVTHVPEHRTLAVNVSARTYGPPIERRTNYQALMGHAALRNRMNGVAFGVIDEKRLGGVKYVGHPTHTFDILVPREKYFETNPEYFPLIEGERRAYYDGEITQLCLTNPEVQLLAMKTIRAWIQSGLDASPHSKFVASVSANDSVDFCQCDVCLAVKREDGSEDDAGAGAAHLRMVNAIARQVAKEFPNAAISTMLYHSAMPRKIKPVSNVIMQMVSGIDWRYRLDDPNVSNNVNMEKALAIWREKVGDGLIYNWSKHVNFGDFMKPIPNLRNIAANIRLYHEKFRLGGMFAQNQQSHGTEMQVLRFYLLARAMWRPSVDSRETIGEFCRPYYDGGAEGVMRYIDYLHDEWGDRLSKGDNGNISELGELGLQDDEVRRLVADSQRILEAAEAAAETKETKLRVAECRLPIWNIMLTRAFGSLGSVFTFPNEWHFRFDAETEAEEVGLAEQWQKVTDFSKWRRMRTNVHWTMQDEKRRGTAWYGVPFEVSDTGGGPLALFFDAVDGTADVFLDGVKVGEQKLGPYAMWNHGFFVPLEKGLAPGRHTLVVRVHKSFANAGIWKRVSIVNMSVPLPDDLRTAAERFIPVARWARMSHLSESYDRPYDQPERNYYSKLRFFLRHGLDPDAIDPWIWPDGDLGRIADPGTVKHLYLSGTQADDTQMEVVAKMAALKTLEMRYLRNVSAAGMVHVSGLGQLEHLDLWHTQIGSAGLEPLAGLKQLETLDLTQSGISDAGIQHLAGLASLRVLNLSENRITDASVEYLKRLTQLRTLIVDSTGLLQGRHQKLSDGALALQAALPDLEIRRY